VTLLRPRGVLFDLDGTLIDTAPEFIHIAGLLRAEAKLPPGDEQTIWHSVSNGAMGMVAAALDISASEPGFEHWRQRFLDHYATSLGTFSALIAVPRCSVGGCHQQACSLRPTIDDKNGVYTGGRSHRNAG
jgi:phosphoglycolate phosphatase-like HAD superfamily hydrolase